MLVRSQQIVPKRKNVIHGCWLHWNTEQDSLHVAWITVPGCSEWNICIDWSTLLNGLEFVAESQALGAGHLTSIILQPEIRFGRIQLRLYFVAFLLGAPLPKSVHMYLELGEQNSWVSTRRLVSAASPFPQPKWLSLSAVTSGRTAKGGFCDQLQLSF